MKLSEAIRRGAAKRPQAHSSYLAYNAAGVPCTCALGAAYEALTGQLPLGEDYAVDQLLHTAFDLDYAVRDAIVRRNDEYGQTREEIAAWLAGCGL